MLISKWNLKKGESPTHVLMNGGQIHVPDADLDTFWRAYIVDLTTGTGKLYVVEQKTNRFKFFVDVDFKSERALTDEDALVLCRHIWDSVGDPGRCVAARAPPRKEGLLIKSGLHIHWPDLVVDRAQALALRTKILLGLEGDHWAQTIDQSVYGGSGLRCLWSHKKPEGAPYVPWRSVPSGDALDARPRLDTLKMFSVRVEGDSKTASPSAPPEASSRLERFIRQNMDGQANARVKAVRRTKKGEGKGLYVETDSRWCERIQAEHKSNHVWFYILDGTIQQKCLNEDCLEFSGREHFLPPSISNEHPRVDDSPRPRPVDLLPSSWSRSFPVLRRSGPRVLGPGSERMEVVPDGDSSV